MKRWTVRVLIAGSLVVLALGVWAAVTFINATGLGGGSSLELWVRGQLLAVAEQYLEPRLELGTFDYQYPDLIVLHNVKLTAQEQDGGAAVDVLHVRRLRLTLQEVPRRGQPLCIRRIVLDQPTLRFTAAQADGGGWVGWSNLLKDRDTPEPPDPSAPAGEVKLSETFRIEVIEVHAASLAYDPRSPDADAQPMLLDDITTVLRVEPEQGNWYALQLDFDRPPLVAAKARGRFDIDAFVLELASAQVRTKLDASAMAHLPPQLQSLIRRHELAGELTLDGSGLLDGGDLSASTASGRLTLTGASIAHERMRLDVQRFEADLSLASGVFDVPRFVAALLRGNISGAGQVRFDDRDAQASMTMKDLRLEDTIRTLAREGEPPAEGEASAEREASTEPQYAGILSGQVTLGAPLDGGLEKMRGGGELHIRDGRLGGLPIISDLIEAIHGVTKVTPVGGLTGPNDRADAAFRFEGDRVRFEGIDIRTTLMAARGHGTLDFAGQLDLLMNAGPLEKVQSLLGGVGDLIGKLTDQIAKYHVTGPASDPQVKLKLGPG